MLQIFAAGGPYHVSARTAFFQRCANETLIFAKNRFPIWDDVGLFSTLEPACSNGASNFSKSGGKLTVPFPWNCIYCTIKNVFRYVNDWWRSGPRTVFVRNENTSKHASNMLTRWWGFASPLFLAFFRSVWRSVEDKVHLLFCTFTCISSFAKGGGFPHMPYLGKRKACINVSPFCSERTWTVNSCAIRNVPCLGPPCICSLGECKC